MKYLFTFFFLLVTSFGYGQFLDHLKKLENKTPVQSIDKIDFIYVINLDHRTEKFQRTLNQLAPYHIVPCRFPAVNGWKLTLEAIWDVGLVFESWMRSGGMGTVYRRVNGKEYHSHEVVEVPGTHYFAHCMPRGAIGCTLSHLSVMQDALNSGYEVVWICEDDIEVIRDPRILSRYIKDLDVLIGRDNWDVFFTFRDYRGVGGQYYTAHGGHYRPNIDTRDQNRFNIDKPITGELRQVGTRFGTQSMIWTKKGMRKLLDYYQTYKIFQPIDMDLCMVPNIKMYSVIQDVVTNCLDAQSDLGSTPSTN